MKIAIEATVAQGKPTGFGQYVINLLRAFSHMELPHEFILLHATKEWTGPDFGPSFKPVSYYLFKQSAAIALRLNRVLKREKVDLFHATCTTGVPPIKSVPSVATIHDLYPLLYPENCKRSNVRAFKLLINWTVKNADYFICNSRFTAYELQSRFKVPEHKTAITYLAPATGNIKPSELRLGFLCVGAIEPRKNQLFLLEAYRRAMEMNPTIPSLTFIGPDRGDGGELRDRIKLYDIGSKVKYLDYLSMDDLCGQYINAACFLFPTLYEGFGMPLLEAMRYQLPVICSNIPVLREVGHNYPVYLPENDIEAWAQAMNDYTSIIPSAETLTDEANKLLSLYSWDKCAEQTMEVYNKILAL